MKLPQTGGCLCGAARYAITQPPLVAYTCHCTACQRLTGSAFSSAIAVVAEAFRFSGGEMRAFQRATDSGRISTRWVCAGCGVWICGGPKPGTAEPNTLVFVRAGTLDDTSWLRPGIHFWTRSAQPWVRLPEGDTRFETQPSDWLAVLRSSTDHQHRPDQSAD
jgi:hypothetical protein